MMFLEMPEMTQHITFITQLVVITLFSTALFGFATKKLLHLIKG